MAEQDLDTINPELFDLTMSEAARPLLNEVKSFVSNEVAPITEEYYRLGENREDRWSYGEGQLELLEGAKEKARQRGLWNFFLPDAETGEERWIHDPGVDTAEMYITACRGVSSWVDSRLAEGAA